MRGLRTSIIALTTVFLLAGCASRIFGPTSKQIKSAQTRPADAADVGSGAVVDGTSSAAASSESKREFRPKIIDILTVFQEKLRGGTSRHYYSESILNGRDIIGELFLVTKELKLHRHPKQDRLLYVISGRADIMLDGSGSSIRAGHVLVIPRGASLRILPTGDQPVRLLQVKAPGYSDEMIDWLKEQDAEPEPAEQEVDPLEPIPVPDLGESSSSEEFQTGTLAPDQPQDVGMGDDQERTGGDEQ